jgi:hypothetical protein
MHHDAREEEEERGIVRNTSWLERRDQPSLLLSDLVTIVLYNYSIVLLSINKW